jgi:ABC-type amino acid transport substrate-binding protein
MARRDMEEKFDLLLDANDTILERVVSFNSIPFYHENPSIATSSG